MNALVGRLAPSPTGHMHLGHARSFLLAWWSIRSRGGRLVLRMEDLDGDRCRPEYADGILRDLEWLGLDWDGPVVLQSDSADAHAAALTHLNKAGLLYPCVCTRREIREAASAPHGEIASAHASSVSPDVYPGTCRGRFKDTDQAFAATGRAAAWRLVVDPGPVSFTDAFFGHQSFDPATEVGDFPVARRDSQVAYQLAVVVDDATQGVTEVLRGRDLLSSTARQILLQGHLGLLPPTWIHVPLVIDAAGDRLAKRVDSLSLHSLREDGTGAGTVVSWAARSVGMEADVDPRADSAPADFLASFDITAMPADDVPTPRLS